MGALCAQWFSDFLGRPLRLARFDPEQRRLADRALDRCDRGRRPRSRTASRCSSRRPRRWPKSTAASRSPAQAPVTMERFRPNLVLDGLDAHGEDHLDEIVFDRRDGPVRLKLVKPCARCTIPDVDPATGVAGHAVGDVLAAVPRRPAPRRRAHLRHERGRSSKASTARSRVGLAAGRATRSTEPRLVQRFKTWQLFAGCVLIWGTTWHAITYQLADLAAGVRRRAALRARRRQRARLLPLARRAAALPRSPSSRRSRCRASFCTACRTSASTTPSASSPPGWSRSATRPRRCSPGSARRRSSASPSAAASSPAACSAWPVSP